MDTKTFKNIENLSYEQLVDMQLWAGLTDAQKHRVHLNSSRLADNDEFLAEFQSWEQPSYNSFTGNK